MRTAEIFAVIGIGIFILWLILKDMRIGENNGKNTT